MRRNYRSAKIRKHIARDQDIRRDELKQLESNLHTEWRDQLNGALECGIVSSEGDTPPADISDRDEAA
ncbi:hypothetical protein ABH935_007165 [Catenulispora sp. GAS73]|uniref:hypothetical protein n=1 Tax=Catenulispora sp. GAS73 TaxID=3156269 RepID=UPI0035160501